MDKANILNNYEMDEQPVFDTPEEALRDLLDRLVYTRDSQSLAELIVDELPWNGYRIYEMSIEEREQFEKEY